MRNMEKINLELGRIEGIGLGLGGNVGEVLQLAADRISRAMNQTESEICYHVTSRQRSVNEETISISVFQPETMTTGEIGELTDRLVKYYLDHVDGKVQNFDKVCNDCIRAATLIEFLMEDRQQRDLDAYAGNP